MRKLPRSSADVQGVAESSVAVEACSASGSGTLVARLGRRSWVLTCEHVVRGATRVFVRWREGRRRFARAEAVVERVDARRDLALLRTRALDLPALPIAEDEPDLYEKVWIVACPEGLFGTAVEALLSGRDGSNGDPDESYQLSGFSSGGASGGTVANAAGELVGVVASVRHDGHGPVGNITFASPLPEVRAFLAEGRILAERARRRRERVRKTKEKR